MENLSRIPNLICLWTFAGEKAFVSSGPRRYELQPGNGSVNILNDGCLSPDSIDLEEGQYLFIPRDQCPDLNIHGKDAQVTVLALVKRKRKSYNQCEAIAGMWNETEKLRQYCLFLNLGIKDSGDQVCGHISGVGGPTPGERWCMDASIGTTPVVHDEWTFAAITYDGAWIKSYLDGKLDNRPGLNPYAYREGIFDGGEDGSDFTVGAVHRSHEMGNFFVGQLGGLAVFNRALSEREIGDIHKGVKASKWKLFNSAVWLNHRVKS